MPPIQRFSLNHHSILTNDARVNTFRQKEVDVTEISYIRSIWLRERDLNPRPPGYELRSGAAIRWDTTVCGAFHCVEIAL